MKFLKETFLSIFGFTLIVYLFFSLGNGSFDFSVWDKEAREAISTILASLSMFIMAIQAYRYLE